MNYTVVTALPQLNSTGVQTHSQFSLLNVLIAYDRLRTGCGLRESLKKHLMQGMQLPTVHALHAL